MGFNFDGDYCLYGFCKPGQLALFPHTPKKYHQTKEPDTEHRRRLRGHSEFGAPGEINVCWKII